MSLCACGYDRECGIWCGYGHTNGTCPPNTESNIAKARADKDRPRCKHCREAAPYGDARNIWLDHHLSWYHRLYWRVKKRLLKSL